ncbi:MAG: hypothetical protein QM757_33455 [Paludibaculum sp.]
MTSRTFTDASRAEGRDFRPHFSQGFADPPDSFEVVPGGAQDLHAAVVILVPFHGNVGDAQALLFREGEHFRVEKPGLVANLGHNGLNGGVAHRLETALGIAEFRSERGADDLVVDAGDELAQHGAAGLRAGQQA